MMGSLSSNIRNLSSTMQSDPTNNTISSPAAAAAAAQFSNFDSDDDSVIRIELPGNKNPVDNSPMDDSGDILPPLLPNNQYPNTRAVSQSAPTSPLPPNSPMPRESSAAKTINITTHNNNTNQYSINLGELHLANKQYHAERKQQQQSLDAVEQQKMEIEMMDLQLDNSMYPENELESQNNNNNSQMDIDSGMNTRRNSLSLDPDTTEFNTATTNVTTTNSNSTSQSTSIHNTGLSNNLLPTLESKRGESSAEVVPTSPIPASLEEEEKLHLLSVIYRCRYCMPTVKDRIKLNELGPNLKHAEYCCAGSALAAALPNNFPVDLLSITEGYLLNSVSRSFLTHPPPPSAGVIQCYILKSGNKFELFMEMKDQPEYQQIKQKVLERGVRPESERSKLLESLFKERQSTRDLLNGIDNRGVEDKMKENNMKSMLLSNADSVLAAGEDIFLFSATRKRAWTGNQYIISTDRDNTRSDGPSIIGKLKSNFGGTEFVMFDIGDKPVKNINKKTKECTTTIQRVCREAGIVQYDHFFEHTGSPIRIKILLPNQSFYHNESLNHTSLNPNSCPNNGSILKQFKVENKTPTATNSNSQVEPDSKTDEAETRRNEENVNANMMAANKPRPPRRELDDLFDFETANQQIECYENLRPVWHDGMNAYVLHFDNHRVREKSVKNFKLIRSNDPEKRTVLQFGRVVDRNVFVMDFAYPLTALQAFEICLSSIDPKLAV